VEQAFQLFIGHVPHPVSTLDACSGLSPGKRHTTVTGQLFIGAESFESIGRDAFDKKQG